MEDKRINAADCSCILCGAQAVAFFPAVDPDIPSNPYCRPCQDDAKMKMLMAITQDNRVTAKRNRMAELQQRVATVNLIIAKIAGIRGDFFANGQVAKMSVDNWGKIWIQWYDPTSEALDGFCLSVAHPLNTVEWYNMSKFRGLVLEFKHYIHAGGNLGKGKKKDSVLHQDWGYSEEDMKEIQNYARELGYLKAQ